VDRSCWPLGGQAEAQAVRTTLVMNRSGQQLRVPAACPIGRSVTVSCGHSRTSRHGHGPADELMGAHRYAHSQADSPQRSRPLTLNPATALVLGSALNLHVRDPLPGMSSLARAAFAQVRPSVEISAVAVLSVNGSQGAARLCSNRADIRWLRPTSVGSAPAPVTAIDQGAVSSHRGAASSRCRTVP
jgi:hypothetical protein